MPTKVRAADIELPHGTHERLILRTLRPSPSHGHAIAHAIEVQSESRCYLAVIVACLALMLCAGAHAQETNEKPAAVNQSPSPLKVASNIVLVRVVVRDAQGNPVEGLRKEDFKIFDRGKEQTITQFEVESALATPPNSAAVEAPGQAPLSAAPAAPGTSAAPARFLALYFDDLNTSFADMSAARDAAEHYISTNLQPQDRVAVFTTGAMLTDFTSDTKLLHEALLKLRVNPRSRTLDHDCPQLSDFQAQQIMENPNNQNMDAWKVANTEFAACDTGSQPQAMAGGAGSSGGMPSGSSAGPSSGGGRFVASRTWQLNARNFWWLGDRRRRSSRRFCVKSDSAARTHRHGTGLSTGAREFAGDRASDDLHFADARPAHRNSGFLRISVAERTGSGGPAH